MTAANLIETTAWTLVHSLWQGALTALLLMFLSRGLRSSAARCAAAIGALGLLLMAAATTFVILGLDAGNATAPSLGTTTPRFAGLDSAVVAEREITSPEENAGVIEARLVEPANLEHAPEPITPPVTSFEFPWQSWIVTLWLVGLVVFGSRFFFDLRAAMRLRKSGIALRNVGFQIWKNRFSALAEKMGVTRPVKLLASSSAQIPVVIGVLRPVILVPVAVLAQLPPAQVEAILLHELAHIRRHDFLVNLLQSLVETLFFFHPAVWWISRKIHEERENCCDDLAASHCENLSSYAGALAALEEWHCDSGMLTALGVAADGGKSGRLLCRIRRLVSDERVPKQSVPMTLTSLLTVAGLVIAFAMIAQADERQGNTPSAPSSDVKSVEITMPGEDGEAKPSAPEGATSTPLEIIVTRKGGVLMGGEEAVGGLDIQLTIAGLDMEDIGSQLERAVEENPDLAAVIRPEKDTPWRHVEAVLDQVKKAGISNVSFALREPASVLDPAGNADAVRGVSLKNVDTTNDITTIVELYEPDPDRPNEMRRQDNVFSMRLGEVDVGPWLYYAAGAGHFYLKVRPDPEIVADIVYGPIPGHPVERLNLAGWLRESPGHRDSGYARRVSRNMIGCGDAELARLALAWLGEFPPSSPPDQHTWLIEAIEEHLEKSPDSEAVDVARAALVKMQTKAEETHVAWEAMRVTLPEEEYQPGEKVGPEHAGIIWSEKSEAGNFGGSPDPNESAREQITARQEKEKRLTEWQQNRNHLADRHPTILALNDDVDLLDRLVEALRKFKYPDNGRNAVTVWRQSTPRSGRYSATYDDDQITLFHAIDTFEDRCAPMDKSAITIFSEDGKKLEFVDYADRRNPPGKRILKRGQLVILLAPPATTGDNDFGLTKDDLEEMQWSDEKHAKLPFGPANDDGLRVARFFDPMLDTYEMGTQVKGRVIFHNNGKEVIEFTTEQRHLHDKWHCRNAKGAKITPMELTLSGEYPLSIFRLEPGQVCEVAAQDTEIGWTDLDNKLDGAVISSWIPAKPGDVITCSWGVIYTPKSTDTKTTLRSGEFTFEVKDRPADKASPTEKD